MIKGLGTDVVDVKRMATKIEKASFLKIAFTAHEIAYCQNKKQAAQHYAARFAAKESYMKALGTGWDNNAEFTEIEVINLESGQPEIKLYGSTKAFFHKSEFKHIFVSLSHTENTAMATVIVTS